MRRRHLLVLSAGALAAPALIAHPARAAVETREQNGYRIRTLTDHPALALPASFGTDGLPTSVQIVGRWGHETDVLRLGALLEAARPWAQHRPKMFAAN